MTAKAQTTKEIRYGSDDMKAEEGEISRFLRSCLRMYSECDDLMEQLQSKLTPVRDLRDSPTRECEVEVPLSDPISDLGRELYNLHGGLVGMSYRMRMLIDEIVL